MTNIIHPDLGDLDAVVREGKRIQHGDGITPDNIRAFNLFHHSALAGHAEAQCLLSYCFKSGRGVQQDNELALVWLQKSAQSGFEAAMLKLGVWYMHSVPPNEEEGLRWCQKAAEMGSNVACIFLAIGFEKRNDIVNVLKWKKEGALRGEFDYLWDIRKFYERRERETIDLPDAYAWVSLFEDRFTTKVLSTELYAFQLRPEEISKYKTTALELKALMSVAQSEQATQQYQDLVRQRIEWTTKAAEKGRPNAQYYLSWCYQEGYGVQKDGPASVAWRRRAAEQGWRPAQKEYAEGVEENHAVAMASL